MTRKPIFDAIKSARDGASFTAAEVSRIDAMLDSLSVPLDAGGIMRASAAGVALIHSFESLKLTSYKDPGSKDGLPITNGWGTTRDSDGRPIPLGVVWDKDKADRLFRRDLLSVEQAVAKLAPVTTQAQFDALVSFTYNLGEGNLKTSTLLKKHNAGDYAGAANEFLKWNKNDGAVMKGLTRRREAEKALYLS